MPCVSRIFGESRPVRFEHSAFVKSKAFAGPCFLEWRMMRTVNPLISFMERALLYIIESDDSQICIEVWLVQKNVYTP